MFLRSCYLKGTVRVSPDQVTNADGASGAFMSKQQNRHEQDIIQLQQHPHDSQPASSSTDGGREVLRAQGDDTNGGTAGEGYPKTRVKTPDRQQKGQVDGEAGSPKVVADDVDETSTDTGTDGTEGAGGDNHGADDGQDKPSGPSWNGEPSHGGTQGKDELIRFDASRHKGIGGQDSSAGSRPVDATNRVVHHYEPVSDTDDHEPAAHWDPSSRHKTPENYDPSSGVVDRRPDHDRDYVNRGNVAADKATAVHSDDASDGSDSSDYNYRYYKFHHPGSVDVASRGPAGGYDRGYVDKGPWRKTGRFGDARPIGRTYSGSDGRPDVGSNRNRAGYNYYPRNNEQDARVDYENYYDNNGRKGYYGNGDGVLLPYRHREVFDYYAPETGTSRMSVTVAFVSHSLDVAASFLCFTCLPSTLAMCTP